MPVPIPASVYPGVLAIVGVSGSGKTTLIERLIPLFRDWGFRIGTLKHDAHYFEVDLPGKDTWRHREAGAEVVAICNGGKVAAIRSVSECPDPLDVVRDYMNDLDLVLVEGFKEYMGFPKIEVIRREVSNAPRCALASLSGIVSDIDMELCRVPRFDMNEIKGIAVHIAILMKKGGKPQFQDFGSTRA